MTRRFNSELRNISISNDNTYKLIIEKHHQVKIWLFEQDKTGSQTEERGCVDFSMNSLKQVTYILKTSQF